MPLSLVNLLLGPNSSGKTTLIQALLLLKQTAESPDSALPLQIGGTYAHHADLGTFDELRSIKDKYLTLGLSWTEVGSNTLTTFETTIGTVAEATHVLRFSYSRAEERYSLTWTEGVYQVRSTGPEGEHVATTLRPPIKCYGFPNEILARVPPDVAETMRSLQLSLEKLLERIFYLGPLRERPSRRYTWAGERPSSLGTFGDKAIEALLALERDAERFNLSWYGDEKTPIEAIQAFLVTLGLADSFHLPKTGPRDYEIRLRSPGQSAEVALVDVGFGLSQVLPVLVLALYAPEGSIILLEQPELHLHPAAQVGLGDVFLVCAKQRGIQFVIETHSEHLLARVQRRVAEAQVASDDIQIYFCHRSPDRSVVETLKLDTFGQIENWPPNFFGDPVAESAMRVQASLRRKRTGM